MVAPHAGAWIETDKETRRRINKGVAPHAGAWIETLIALKHLTLTIVAPHAGAWIETLLYSIFQIIQYGRPSRRGVD